jgi:hypothetical protein
VRLSGKKENQKAKVKSQKAKISDPGRGPGWGGISTARDQTNRQ